MCGANILYCAGVSVFVSLIYTDLPVSRAQPGERAAFTRYYHRISSIPRQPSLRRSTNRKNNKVHYTRYGPTAIMWFIRQRWISHDFWRDNVLFRSPSSFPSCMTIGALLLVFSDFFLPGKQTICRFSGVRAANRWRRSVEATKLQYRCRGGKPVCGPRLRSATGSAEKSGRAATLLLPTSTTTYETRTGRRRARRARSAVCRRPRDTWNPPVTPSIVDIVIA